MAGFKQGDTIELTNGDIIVVDRKIGEGGTADTYRVINSTKNKYQCAKHLYGGRYSTDPRRYYEKCKILFRWGAPSPVFVWCEDNGISEYFEDTESFLYVMDYLEGYHKASKIIRSPEILDLKERLEICTRVAEAARAAEEKDLVYGDWSANNVLWKKTSQGKLSVRIIDTDPMSLPGIPLGLGGTGTYRAPELMLGGIQTQQSDIHSLAVLTFRIFCGRHPLDGKLTRSEAETEETIMKYYAKEPLFIFDGKENEPSALVAKRFYSLPDPLQTYYRYIFSQEALHGNADRLSCGDFLKILRLSSN